MFYYYGSLENSYSYELECGYAASIKPYGGNNYAGGISLICL